MFTTNKVSGKFGWKVNGTRQLFAISTWAKRSVQGLGSGLSSFVPESGVCRLYKSVPFTEKRPQIPETGMKDGFEEIEREFPFLPVEHSVGGKQDYLLERFSLEPGSALGKKREKNWRAKQADSRQPLGSLCSPIFVLFVPVFSLKHSPPPPHGAWSGWGCFVVHGTVFR